MGIKHIVMPDLGESVTEATVTQWLTKPGDFVKKYQPILEAQSDKVITEIPSEFDGEIVEILVPENNTVPIGTKLLKIEVEAIESDGKDELEEVTVKIFDDTSVEEDLQEAFEPEVLGKGISTNNSEILQTSSVTTNINENTTKVEGKPTVRYSPAVVRIAQEREIDLKLVKGTGRHGRITRKDVESFDPASVKSRSAFKDTVNHNLDSKNRQEVVKADGVRRLIAENITRSANEIPHAWIMVEADVTNIVNLRNALKEEYKNKERITLSYFPFFVKAVAQALKNHPLLNASWDNGNIIYNNNVNISIAVATDDHLYVPVIKNADQYSVSGLTKEINRIVNAAGNGHLTADEMRNGTFTVNNTGSFGSISSMGIINYPQAAILQVESIQKRIVPTEDGFKIASMVNLCLSIDHRLIDGLHAGRFLQNVKENLSLYTHEANIY